LLQLHPPPSLSTTGREYSLESGYNSTSNCNSNPCSPGSRPGTRNTWGRASSKSVSDATSPKAPERTRKFFSWRSTEEPCALLTDTTTTNQQAKRQITVSTCLLINQGSQTGGQHVTYQLRFCGTNSSQKLTMNNEF